MRLKAYVAAAALLVSAAAVSSAHEGHDNRPGATRFDLEVKITKTAEGGLAPAAAADAFGNQYVVAPKDTEPASIDTRGSTTERAAAWRWWSADHGATWSDLPGLPVGLDAQEPGFGGDVATDDAGGVFVVDDHRAYLSMLRWKASGLGDIAFDGLASSRQVGPGTGRPRLAAHGNGHLLLLWPRAEGTMVLVSTDGGDSFTPIMTMAGSTCSAAAPRHRQGYALVCTDGTRTSVLVARHDTGDFGAETVLKSLGTPIVGTPSVSVDSRGRVFVAITHGVGLKQRIDMVHSADSGKSWSAPRRLDDIHGGFRQVELTSAPNGKLGIAAYYKEFVDSGWEIVASVFNADHGPGPLLESFARHTPTTDGKEPEPPGDRLGIAFDGESRLSVLWSANNVVTLPSGVSDKALRDVWFVRSQSDLPIDDEFEVERPKVGPLPDCRIEGQVTKVGAWQRIRKPSFPAMTLGGADQITSYAISGLDPARMWVTNGTTLMRSEDAGCTWQQVWSLQSAPGRAGALNSANARITRLVAPGSRLALHSIWLEVEETVAGGGPRPHVVYSKTGDATDFSFIDSGLPTAGRPVSLAVNAVNPEFAYVAIDDGTGGHAVLYGTEDAQTWTARGPTLEQVQGPAVTSVVLDPFVPNGVWEVSEGKLRHSTDGGRTWTGGVPSVEQLADAGTVTAVDVFHVSGGQAAVMAFGVATSGRIKTLASADNGAHWTVATAEGLEAPVESVAHGSAPNRLVVSTAPADGSPPEVYHFHIDDGEWDPLTPKGVTAPFHVSADLRYRPTFYGNSAVALWRYAGDEIEAGPPAPLPIGPAFTDPKQPNPVLEITPGTTAIQLAQGESRRVHLDLAVPPRPRRVDVYFLLDTSSSMSDDIALLRSSLTRTIATLQSQNVDLWAGLGIYKTEGDPPHYQRVLDLTHASELAAKLAAVQATGGAGNETQMIALEQTLTGSGEPNQVAPIGSVCDVAPDSPGCSVAPGQQADFRSGALRVVVHATDSPFRNPAGTRQNTSGRPDIAGLAADFAAAGIHVIGVSGKSPNFNEVGAQYSDARLLAERSGALAGPGGADCNGDGRVIRPGLEDHPERDEPRAGDPLVCASLPAGPAPMILSLLRGLPTMGVVGTTVQDPAGYASGGVATDRLDLAAPHALGRDVTLTCGALSPGAGKVTVNGRVDRGPVTRAVISVTCGSVTVPAREVVPPVVPPFIPNPAPPLVPANPPPAAQAQAQVQAQSQVQANPAAGIAQEEQQQIQLAGELAGFVFPTDEDAISQLAMTRRDHEERVARALLATALLAAASVGAVAYRRRFRTAADVLAARAS